MEDMTQVDAMPGPDPTETAIAEVRSALDAFETALGDGRRAPDQRRTLASAIGLLAGQDHADRARIVRALRD